MNLKSIINNLVSKGIKMFIKVNPDKVVFSSFGGISYSDNSKAVSEAVHRLCPEKEIVWLMKKSSEKKDVLPDYIRVVDSEDKIKILKETLTCGAYVSNNLFPLFDKRPEQFLVQTWHGDRGFKKCLHDSPFSRGLVLAEEHDGFCNLAVAGSELGEYVYRHAFGYKGEILTCGCPKNDKLINPEAEEVIKIKDALKIPEGTKILLYAPTLRRNTDNGSQQAQDIDIEKTLEVLEAKYSCSWCCIVRAHPAIKEISGLNYDGKRIIDVTKYEDMADLLLVSDMLITDYSSCAGDFALVNRPILIFQPDKQEYFEKDRTLYFEMDDTPYYVAENQQELEQLVLDLTDEGVTENCKAILNFYKTSETGKASETVAKRIIDWCDKIKN